MKLVRKEKAEHKLQHPQYEVARVKYKPLKGAIFRCGFKGRKQRSEDVGGGTEVSETLMSWASFYSPVSKIAPPILLQNSFSL